MHTASRSRIHRKSFAIAIGMAAIVVYGSLYGIRFPLELYPRSALYALLGTWDTLSRPGDVIANVVFYLPLGFFIARSISRIPLWPRAAASAMAGLSLSIAMELLQYHIPGRNSAMSDVYANTVGALLGGVIAVAGVALSRRDLGVAWNPPVFLLLACWLGNRLYPYVPVIDLHKYWDALKPLWMSPRLDLLDMYVHMVYWLVIGVLLDALVGASRSRIALLAFIAVLTGARILIAQIALYPDEIVGAMLGLVLWFLLSHIAVRVPIVAGFLVVSVIVQALEPFQFLSSPRPFGWIPFRSLVRGSPETALLSFFEKFFTYGGLVWLFHRNGYSWLKVVLWSAGLVMALRHAQTYIPGRSAEITDVVLLLVAAVVLRMFAHTMPNER